MLDLKLLRAETEAVRTALARRGPDVPALLDGVLALDVRRRELIPQVENLKAEQNAAGQAIAAAKQSGKDATEALAAMKEVAARGKELGESLTAVEAELDATLAQLPNLPDPTAADADTVI